MKQISLLEVEKVYKMITGDNPNINLYSSAEEVIAAADMFYLEIFETLLMDLNNGEQ